MKNFKILKSFSFVFQKIKHHIVALLALLPFSVLLPLISPKFFQILIDDVIGDKQESKLLYVIFGLIFVYFLRLIFDSLNLYLTNKITNIFSITTRKVLWDKYYSCAYNTKINQAGEMKLRMMDDVNNISMFIKEKFIDVMYQSAIAVGALIAMFICDPFMTLCCISIIPIVLFINHRLAKKIQAINEEARNINSRYINSTHNAIRDRKEIKIQNAEKIFFNRFCYFRSKLEVVNLKNIKYWFFTEIFADFKTDYISKVLIYCIGMFFILNGTVTIGTLLMFAEYFNSFFLAVDLLNTKYESIQSDEPYFERIIEILSICDTPSQKSKFVFNNEIHIQIDDFTYPNSNIGTLKNVTLDIKKGDFIVITGKSGCGKSTLMKLLLNMHPEYNGEITFDEIPARSINADELYQSISIVVQNDYLFNMSIRENMLLASPNATDEEILSICKKLGAYDMIMSMEEKLDSVIGENGAHLSGGQKQKLCIARALLKKPQILILDEATNSLDVSSENTIIDTLRTDFQEITLIAVSHKPSLIKRAERIINIERN